MGITEVSFRRPLPTIEIHLNSDSPKLCGPAVIVAGPRAASGSEVTKIMPQEPGKSRRQGVRLAYSERERESLENGNGVFASGLCAVVRCCLTLCFVYWLRHAYLCLRLLLQLSLPLFPNGLPQLKGQDVFRYRTRTYVWKHCLEALAV